MPILTILIGDLLVVLGVLSYALAPQFGANRSVTALIPAFVGGALSLCGAIAFKPAARRHAMHAAVAIATLGFLAAAARYLPNPLPPTSLAPFSLVAMLVLCGVLVVAGVRSFIAARSNRADEP